MLPNVEGMWRLFKAVAAISIVISASACSGSVDSAEVDLRPEVRAFLERLGDDLPEPQRAALGDGVIVFAEYEAAYERTVNCLREQGLKVEGPLLVNRGRFLGYAVAGGPGDALSDAVCRREHLEYVDELWRIQALPTDAEMETIRREYAACLAAAGVAVEDSATLQEVDQVAGEALGTGNTEQLMACVELYSLGIFVQGSHNG